MRPLRILYVQVLIGMALGIALGAVWGDIAAWVKDAYPGYHLLAPEKALKPIADGFIRLIKMVVAVVIFCTIATGIARMRDIKAFGRLGARTLIYFEVVSTFALVVGLIVGNLVRPGAGMNVNPADLDPSIAAGYAEKAKAGQSFVEHLLAVIPDSFVGAFADGNLLQVLVLAILTGFACARLDAFGDKVAGVLEDIAKLFFAIIAIVVRFAPLGAFGAMAFTIAKYGVASLVNLAQLIVTFYATSLIFVLVVLGAIAAVSGFSILKFLRYIREELLIVLGTSSSETVLPQMMQRLQRLGAGPTTTGLVIPTGYSFNLDGTNIYMTLATLFLAFATNTHLSLGQQLTLLVVAMLTSKGASGVTGAGFITLSATLAVVPDIPIVALALLVGVDRFMSECRALTNLVGNGVATLVVARWEGDLDREQLARELDAGPTSLLPAAHVALAED
ncbi:MAG TPA: C4-dicarboxylate transporter DctA [Phenylobacterium sp.]